jgi:hypothetical protein
MYYPLSQITTNLYTNGDEFTYNDTDNVAQSYTGNYFKTSDGKFFTGKTPQDVPTTELTRIVETPTNESIVDIVGDYPFGINPASIGYSPFKSLPQISNEPPKISIPFPTQADAEAFIGQTWEELLAGGVEAVTLYDEDREVYGPMSLKPAE